MDISLNDIATQIINGVLAGLKAPPNYAMSLQQIKDEFAQERNAYLEAKSGNIMFESEGFMQTLKKIAVAKKDFANIPQYSTNRQEYHADIPKIIQFNGLKSVEYIAAMDKPIQFKVVFGQDIFYALKDRYTKNMPTAWIQDNDCWLLNPPVQSIQHITMRVILENPKSVNRIAGMKFMDDDPYPIPNSAIQVIRDKMIDKYIRQYRYGTIQPAIIATDPGINTGSK